MKFKRGWNKITGAATLPGWKEIVFFLFYFIFLNVMPVIESAVQHHEPQYVYRSVWYFSMAGLLNIPPFLFYYQVIIPRFLFKKRYGMFILLTLVFLAAYDGYLRMVTDGLMPRMSFLPETVRQMAADTTISDRFWIRLDFSFTVKYLLAVIALAGFVKYIRDGQEMDKLQEIRMQSELDYLKAQINPHFFFNTLNNIYSLALVRSDLTESAIVRLSGMMHYVLDDSGKTLVSLEQELDFLRNYADTEQIRFPAGISVRYEKQGKTGNKQIQPMLLIPLVENAFKHGIREELDKGYVIITAVTCGNKFKLQVKNSKSKPAAIQSADGLGLINVKKRLDLLYPQKHELLLSETEDAFEAGLTLYF